MRYNPSVRVAAFASLFCGFVFCAPRAAFAQPVLGEPLRDFLLVMCWAGTEGATIRDAWLAVSDSVALVQNGNPILGGSKIPFKPKWSVSVPDSLRTCAAHASTAPLRGLHLLDAARVKLGLNDDAEAEALTEQYLKEVGTRAPVGPFVADRAWALMLAANDRAVATPARWVTAERLVAELDRLAQAPLPTRAFAHLSLAAAAAWEHDDAKVLREAETLYALWATNKQDMEEHGFAGMAVGLRASALLRLRGVAAAKAAVDSAYAVLAATGHARGVWGLHEVYTTLGKPAIPIQGTWWYHAPDSGRTSRPASGKVTIVFKTGHNPFAEQASYGQYRDLRTLQEKYGTRGLEIISVDETYGWFRDSLYENPAAEAERRRRFFLEDHQIPGMLAIYHNRDWHQLPDGRWRSKPSPQDVHYPMKLTLIDPQGNVAYVEDAFPEIRLAHLDMLIGRLLAH